MSDIEYSILDIGYSLLGILYSIFFLAIRMLATKMAIMSMRHDCLLLTADKDFERIAGLSDLELA